MKKIILLILTCWSLQSTAQSIDFDKFSSQVFKSNSKKIFSNSDFVDSLIKDKRIILLGELDHGDGTSFELKTELIKYLHEKHGFNKLVFEAGIMSCNKLSEAMERGKSTTELTPSYIYYIWSQVEETEHLFEYIDEEYLKGNPIKIVGIDPQFSGIQKEKTFIELLEGELTDLELAQKRFIEFSYELKIMSEWLNYPNSDEHQIDESTFYSHLNYFKEKVLTQMKGKESVLWEVYFENIEIFTKIKWKKREGSFELRDYQMFKNLKYWLTEDKDEKIIIWAANAHIIRNDIKLKGKDSDYEIIGLKKLGDYIFREYPKDAYSIAISARTGRTLNFLNKQKTIKIGKNKSCSLEEKLKDLEIALVDLKLFEKYMNLEEYESQLFYPNIKCMSKWSNQFDGIIFIDEMKPSTAKW